MGASLAGLGPRKIAWGGPVPVLFFLFLFLYPILFHMPPSFLPIPTCRGSLTFTLMQDPIQQLDPSVLSGHATAF